MNKSHCRDPGKDNSLLKPNITPRMRSQLMQQMTFGKIRFDIERGCLRNQHIEWDEQVIGFDTADSLMKYVAEYIETFDVGDRTADQSPTIDRSRTSSPHTSDRQIRLPEDKPLIRR